MFKISRLQMAEIVKTAVRDHEQRMVRKLTQQFPGGCLGVSKDQLVDRVRQGIQRAALRKLSSEKHVGKFIAVATALGQEFDMDPRFEWADELLGQVTPQSAPRVIELLSEKAAEHLKGQPGAIAAEAVKALVGGPAPGDEPLSETAEVGDPVTPCPKLAPRRLYSFSS
jgi:hypothetical protein